MGISPPPSPRVLISEEDRKFAQRIILDGTQFIGIGPGATHLFKLWPAEKFAELCEKMIAANGPFPHAKIVVLGSLDECITAQPIFNRMAADCILDAVNRIDLLQAAAVLERCMMHIANDKG